MLTLIAGPNGVVVDPALGNIPDLWFGPLTPLWKAQWYGTLDDDADVAPVERRLAGDFLCLPFGASDLIGGPIHGATANSRWEVIDRAADRARLRLTVPVMGASVEKRLRLAAHAPLLYQTHVIDGGAGRVTLAHHAMVHAAGARLAFSAKRAVLAPDPAMQPGMNLTRPGGRATDLSAVPGLDGPLDLTRYPEARCEDFVTLVEAAGSPLGWTAVTRDRDVVFVVKDPRVLPVTMLWLSNGARTAHPWNGRHTGVLGIEDGIAAGSAGHRAALGDNPVAREGVATALDLGRRHEIRHVIGAIPRPEGWQTVAGVSAEGSTLTILGDDGSRVEIPILSDYFPGGGDRTR